MSAKAPLRLLSIRPEVIVGKLALVTVQCSLIFRHLPKSNASDQSISKWFYVIQIPFQWFRNLQDSKLAWKTSSEFSRPALNAQKVSSLWGIETPKFSKVPNGAWELGFQLRYRCESPWVAKSEGTLQPQTHPEKKMCFFGGGDRKYNEIENTEIWQIFSKSSHSSLDPKGKDFRYS